MELGVDTYQTSSSAIVTGLWLEDGRLEWVLVLIRLLEMLKLPHTIGTL